MLANLMGMIVVYGAILSFCLAVLRLDEKSGKDDE